jgi:ABC-type transporter Mla subunit MlaD
MKELVESGAQASKVLAVKAGSKAQDLGEKGYKASKDLLQKAGAKAQELGEVTVLKVEIKQLEGQAQKLLGRLGAEVYGALVERETPNLSSETPALKAILTELAQIKEEIEKRERDLQARKGSL